MGCAEKDCCTKGAATGAIAFPGTNEPNTPWKLYNHLIAGIPEDVVVRDYCLGTHWSYVEADSGMGVSFTTTGGARRGYTGDLRGMSLREVAELSKSWCFEEASLGVAALNAWYSQRSLLDPLRAAVFLGATHGFSPFSGDSDPTFRALLLSTHPTELFSLVNHFTS